MATTDTNLYRFLHKSEWPSNVKLIVDDRPTKGILDPQFYEKIIRSGQKVTTRDPDVELGIDGKTGETVVKSGGGTSLWDQSDALKGSWRTFTIPDGTQIPASLRIVKGKYNKERKATHYQIEVHSGSLPIDAFKGALDNLARSAVVRSIEIA